jgi:hypothetical protein
MSFNSEIFTALSTEGTITAVTDNIYFNHLPDNYDKSNNVIIYDSFVSEALHTLPLENYGDEYTLSIKAISSLPVTGDNIGEIVKTYLKTLSSSSIRSIAFQRDVYVYNEEENIHILHMDFVVDYCNV